MDTQGSSPTHRWSLYADPEIFQVAATAPEDGWISVTMEVDPKDVQGVGTSGKRLLSQDVPQGEPNDALASFSLLLKLEEIPHMIAILNEIYRQHHGEAIAALEFEPDFEFPRRDLLSSGQSLTWPIASRLEPARDAED